jgi:membrane protein implicated in regulation of membrane protease activity
MQIVDFLAANGSWSWIIAGLVLLALEIFVPGGFLLWLGISGMVVGGITLLTPLGWAVQWLIFGVLALVTISIWVRVSRNRQSTGDRPYLNRRADRYVGHEAVLEQAITQGFGRIVLGDTVWRVSGHDMPSGSRVRVVGSDGNVLRVERIG